MASSLGSVGTCTLSFRDARMSSMAAASCSFPLESACLSENILANLPERQPRSVIKFRSKSGWGFGRRDRSRLTVTVASEKKDEVADLESQTAVLASQMAELAGQASAHESAPESAGHDSESAAPPAVKGLSNKVVGVLGGGQLGRMLCQAASPLGLQVAVLDPMPDAPAAAVAAWHQVGSFRDREAVREFAKGCDVLTVEIEHVDVEVLDELAAEGVDIEPSPGTLRIIQDKYEQKVHLRSHNVPLPDFVKVDSLDGLRQAGESFGYPLMIKARRMAYDGRGNAVAQSEGDLERAVAALGGIDAGLYAEKWARFEKELAVMVARARDGTLRSYPVVETRHKDNICHTVEAPASVPDETAAQAVRVAEAAVSSLSGAGVFGVELFLLPGGQILLNEVAPRPHNSGHYTIEACVASQYEQHLRAVLGLPLGDTSLKVPAAAMLNILGEQEGQAGFQMARELMWRAASVPGVSIHWYNKPEIRPQRKMGHITLVGPDLATLRLRLRRIARAAPGQGNASEAPLENAKPGVAAEVPPQVGIIMGSDSDLPVMAAASQVLAEFGIPHEVTVVSAHRTPARLVEYAQSAHKRGLKAIIAGAGGAAHLPGMVAAMTPLPVIGVPVRASSLDGMDSLLSIVQMPRGVPVATVAINNATNAALLAARLMAPFNPAILQKMMEYQEAMETAVLDKAERLERIGWKDYLANSKS